MAPCVHVHLQVTDLERSRRFYEQFLGVAPVKRFDDYAKFLPPFAPLNLALSKHSDGSSPPTPAGHLGLQLDSPDAVRAQLQRVRAAGIAVREEMGVDCCHANQDKFWVSDPDGVEWEIYFLNHDLPPPSATLPTIGSATEGCCVRTTSDPRGR